MQRSIYLQDCQGVIETIVQHVGVSIPVLRDDKHTSTQQPQQHGSQTKSQNDFDQRESTFLLAFLHWFILTAEDRAAPSGFQ